MPAPRPDEPDLFSGQEAPPRPAKPAPWAPGTILAEVAVESVVRGAFTYLAPPALAARLAVGARVRVPFGGREAYGYFLGTRSEAEFLAEGIDPAKLKPIRARVDDGAGDDRTAPLLTHELIALARWIARRYVCGLGTVLAAMLPAGVKRGAEARRARAAKLLKPPADHAEAFAKLARRAPKQAAVLERLAQAGGELGTLELQQRAKASPATLETLRKAGWLALVEIAAQSLGEAFAPEAAAPEARLELTEAQTRALARIRAALQAERHAAFLLEGVTGSGKTEVYLRALEHARAQGRQGIVLVPEIALTPQTAQRFETRLGRDRVAVLHSHLTDGERAEAWRAARAGKIDVVVGARSALFAPLPRLGCVVVDEEHEGSYKQDSAPRYHAREAAVERARLAGAVAILGSATPALESAQAARTGRYERLELPGRVLGLEMPEVLVVDMRAENRETKKFNYLSRALRKALTDTLERKEQAILFLNRRGFATVVTCPRCGHTESCQNCDITLIEHKQRQSLHCHYCNFEKPVPSVCSACGAAGLKFWGLGTERIEQEVAGLYPQARVARMDSDTMTKREAYVETLSAFRAGRLDVLVGTQMIAKGLDFPNVTLVGIVLADTALHMPDFRSRERTFQLLEQVAGRAGRSAKGGRVIVQTHLPEDPAVRFAARHDYAGFAEAELQVRRQFGYPPFTVLARVLVRGKDAEATRRAANEAAAKLRDPAAQRKIQVLGPSPAPLARLENLYRFHLLLKAPDGACLADLFELAALDKMRGAEFQVDVDPLSML
ncbi:MAG: primosomal protein N' [Planctomycetes bacterium]|nr:primosomal protein N' [Planctomycetota bacterium]